MVLWLSRFQTKGKRERNREARMFQNMFELQMNFWSQLVYLCVVGCGGVCWLVSSCDAPKRVGGERFAE